MNSFSLNIAHRDHAFTVPEMLAVVAVIMIAIAILLPAFRSGREWGRDATCRSNQRQIGIAFKSYALDNTHTLPPNTNGNAKGDWLTYAPGATTPDQKWANGPQTGTIYRYVSGSAQVYLCPSLPKGVLGSGKGSNGRFDYAAFSGFSGAKTYNISAQGRVNVGGVFRDIITPIIIEEDPVQLNGNNREGHFANVDLFGQWHHDGGSFAAIDGSVQRLDYPSNVQVFGSHFESRPRAGLGNWTTIGPGGPPIGWWNSQ